MGIGLDIRGEEREKRVLLRLDGRLDATTSPVLEKKIEGLLKEKKQVMLLDFVSVNYLSSAGIRLLLSMTKKIKEKKGELVLFSLGDEVKELIKMAGFDRILHICKDEKEGLKKTERAKGS